MKRDALLASAGAALALSLGLVSSTALAALPGFGGPAPCPPNTSCVPSTPPAVPGTCGPAPGGATCGAGGPAARNSSPGMNVGAGNPINVITGNKYQREVDMAPLPGVLGLEIVRHYNSAYSRPGNSTNLIGRGWKLSYETELHASASALQIVQADGARTIFNRDPRNPSLCASINPADGTVAVTQTPRGEEYVWRWPEGRQLSFNSAGKLVQILAADGQFVSMQHDRRGLLLSVTDPQGRTLRLHYPGKNSGASSFRGVQQIDSPVGRFSYAYGAPQQKGGTGGGARVAALVMVRTPGGARTYHYEDSRHPTLLTGISELADQAGKPAWERIATYGYDANGKAVLSMRGAPGTRGAQVRLSQEGPGITAVVDERGRKTLFRHAVLGGQHRLLEVRGAGCAGCGDTNVRYRYDTAGRHTGTVTLDEQGQPVASQDAVLDSLGRPLRVTRTGYRDGKPVSTQWERRYEYDGGASQPVLVARPSIVPGREQVTLIRYASDGAAAGQPLSITERGFAAEPESGDGIVAIERMLAYRYDREGRQIAIDGALANGPKASPDDSDITRIDYDPRTRLPWRTVAPGNVITEVLERDAALRPRVLRVTDGTLVRTTTIRSNWRGQPEEVRVDSGPAGSAAQLQLTRYRYGADGRLLAMTGADGRVIAAPQAPAVNAATQLSGTQVSADWSGRPVAWRDAAGQEALRAVWGTAGTAAETHVLAYTTQHAQALRLVDDFGRVTAIRNPGQGWQIATHDAAGNMVALRDPRGAVQKLRWDHAGRVQEVRRFAAGAAQPEETLSYRYDGSFLRELRIRDADGERVTSKERDARGLLVRESLQILPAGALAEVLQPVRLAYLWRYDEQGRVVARSVVDQHGRAVELAQELDREGRPVRIASRGVLPASLGASTVTRRIEWKGGFASSIEHGDGSVDRYAPPQRESGTGISTPGLAAVAGEPAAPLAPPGEGLDRAGLPAAIDTVQGSQHLRWNAAGQLASTQRRDGASRYVYDAYGQRALKLVNDAQGRSVVTVSFYQDRRLAAEAAADGSISYAYAHLGWRALAQIDARADTLWQRARNWLVGAPARALHTDRAGRVLSMSEGGRTVWQERASQPGLIKVSADASAHAAQGAHQPLRYVGQYHDLDSGLAYHGARWFDPARGRFLSPDPVGVGDALDALPANLLLDLYAYAGGRPDEFFDPDGAARIRYFAITTGANGRPLGTTVGFTKARWAFIVDNVQAGGGTSALGQKRNQYAQNGTGLLVDVNGNFLTAGQTATTWTGGAGGVPDLFTEHYGTNLISIPEFTITMSDDDATTLIASYIAADRTALFGASCPARNRLLPQIRFAAEELNIDVTSNTMSNPANSAQVQAQSQRIVECGAGSDADAVMRRLEKYNYGAMLLESAPSQIYKDCSRDGCPGLSLRRTSIPNYTASYGQTQFIGTTMVETLRLLRSRTVPIDAEGRRVLRLDDAALWNEVNAAYRNATFMIREFNRRTAAAPDWAGASAAERQAFMTGTGLNAANAERVWNDVNRWKRTPTANFNGEARAAFATEVLFANQNVRNYLMGIFRDSARGGSFYRVSMALMRHSYDEVEGRVNQTNNVAPRLPNGQANPAWAARQRQIEIELGMRVGRSHNGDYTSAAASGTMAQVVSADLARAGRQYAHRLMNVYEHPYPPGRVRQPTGDYFAMRCTTDLPNSVPRGGIQVNRLNLQ